MINSRFVQNLVSLLGFKEGGGTTIHNALGHHHGVYSGTGYAWGQGPSGPSVVFDGSSNIITIPQDVAVVNECTFAVWVKVTTLPGSYTSFISIRGAQQIDCYLKSTGFIALYVTTFTNQDPTLAFIPTGVWTHFAFTCGFNPPAAPNETERLYVNGQLVAAYASNATLNNSLADTILGFSTGAGTHLAGEMCSYARWDRALEPADIAELAKSPDVLFTRRKRYVAAIVAGGIVGSTTIPTAETFYSPGTVSSSAIVGSTMIPSAETFYAGSLGSFIIGSAIIPTAETFYSGGSLAPPGTLVGISPIPSAETFFSSGGVGTGFIVGSTMIPSEENFPTSGAVLSHNLTGKYMIPSAEQFFYGGVVMEDRAITVFVAGQPRSILARTIQATLALQQTNTLQFDYRDAAATFHAEVGQEVLLYAGTERIFGGTVDESTESNYPNDSGILAQVKASAFDNIFDHRVVGEFFPQGSITVEGIIAYITNVYLSQDGFTYDASDGDPGQNVGILGDQLFNWVTVRDAFNSLSNITTWAFNVDAFRVIRWFPVNLGLGNAPFNITDSGTTPVLSAQATSAISGAVSISVRNYRGTYANRVWGRSSTQQSALWTDTYTTAMPGPFPNSQQPPDGIRQAFFTKYPMTTMPSVTLNGVPQRVISLLDVATTPSGSWDFYWIPPQGGFQGGNVVQQNFSETPPSSASTLIVTYATTIAPINSVQCNAQILARQAVEGGSGLYETVMDLPSTTTLDSVNSYITGLLDRYGCVDGIPQQVIYSTDTAGVFPGMLQSIARTVPLIASASFQVSQVTFTDIDGQFLRYQVTADKGYYQGNWLDFYGAIVNRGKLPQPQNRMQYLWQIAPSYPGIVNPGLHAGTQPTPNTVQNSVEIMQSLMVTFTAPGPAQDVSINVFVNGNSTGSFIYPAGVYGPVQFNYSQQNLLHKNDTMLVNMGGPGGADPLVKDGSITLMTAVSVT